jgi:hypothetical protein
MAPRNSPSGEHDPYLLLLERIDTRQEEMGADIKSMQRDMADGRVKFENHEGRLRALEIPRPPSRVEPSTGRTERKDTGPLTERLSVGAWVKIAGSIAAIVAALFAGKALL